LLDVSVKKTMRFGVAGSMRFALGWVAALVMLFGQAGAALAQTPSQVIFGPVSVKLPSSSLFSFSNSFNLPASVTGPYLLRVKLSAPNSLTSLSFKLNNVQVLSLADFAGGKTQVDRTVTVMTKNSFSLQLAGKTGTVITITVFATPNLPKPTSLTPDPLVVTFGASRTLTATLSPTPTAAGSLSVSSANSTVATVPASVSFASGQTSVPIPVTTRAVGSAVITASANGGQASATVNVMPAPPTVASLAPATLSLIQGSSGALTVTISAAQTTNTTVSVATSAAGVATVPLSVIVPAGAVGAPIAVNAVAPGAVQITASLNNTSATASVQVTLPPPPVISGQSPKDETLPGGSTPQISAQYRGVGSSIDVNRVKLLFDGLDVTSQATVTDSAIAYQVTKPLSDATHAVTLTVADLAGGSATQTWSFLVDDPAPNFYSETPRDIFLAVRNPRIRVLLSGFNIVPSSIRITLDGNDVTAQADVATDRIIFTPVSPLGDGLHAVNVVATDARGVTAGKQWSFTVELPPPPSTTEDGVRTDDPFIPEVRVLP